MIRSICRTVQSSLSVVRSAKIPFHYGNVIVRFYTRVGMEIMNTDELRASVVKQGGLVRQLKKDGAAQEEVTAGMFLFCVW